MISESPMAGPHGRVLAHSVQEGRCPFLSRGLRMCVRRGGGSGSAPAQVQLGGGGVAGPARPPSRAQDGSQEGGCPQSREPGRGSVLQTKSFASCHIPRRNSLLTTAWTVSTRSLERVQGDMPAKEPGQRPDRGVDGPAAGRPGAPGFWSPLLPAFIPQGLGTVRKAGSLGRPVSLRGEQPEDGAQAAHSPGAWEGHPERAAHPASAHGQGRAGQGRAGVRRPLTRHNLERFLGGLQKATPALPGSHPGQDVRRALDAGLLPPRHPLGVSCRQRHPHSALKPRRDAAPLGQQLAHRPLQAPGSRSGPIPLPP